VGAGAAGIVLAVELARLGKRVLLLEGGGAAIEAASQEPYASEVTGLPHRGVQTGRFRAQGGTTTKWGGQILELDASDFEKRDWVSGSGWPFAKSELTPFYEKALAMEGLSGVRRADGEVWRRLGMAEPAFDTLTTYLSRWCPEPNFAVLHRETLQSEKVTVWLHANVVAMEMEGEAVRSVRCRTLTGREARFEADDFIFCLGGIESTRFFLQPREGALPWNESGLLGRHFQDHIDCNVATVQLQDARRFHALFDNIFLEGYKYHPKIRMTAESARAAESLNAGATMTFQCDADEQMAEMKIMARKLLRGGVREIRAGDAWRAVQNLPLLVRQMWRYKMEHRMYNPADARILLRVHCEQEPESASSVSLSTERDALGMLRTRLDWRISDMEQRTILQFAQLAKRDLVGVAELKLDEELEAGDAAFRLRCDDSNHHMGGMRMAATRAGGVVDTNLRVFGTRNCYVCSSAVFPSSGYSNPTHTLLALAMRLGEHLGTGIRG